MGFMTVIAHDDIAIAVATGSVGYDPQSGNQERRPYPHQQKPVVSHMTITSCIKFCHMHI